MTKKTKSSKSDYQASVRQAEKIRNGDHEAISVMRPGDAVRQGDVYLVGLDEMPTITGKSETRQLAPGDTQGSRHVAEGDCDVLTASERDCLRILNRLIPETRGQQLFFGPIIVARGPVMVAHPEHGDRTLPGEATYAVVYQRAWA